jgi:DnaJ family protein A protein 2
LAGDLILVVQEKPHDVFTRKGADLFIKRSINLAEALIGFQFKLKHLDGTEYSIYTGRGEIIGDHDKKVVRGLGMPYYKDNMSFGNLIIEFSVNMPKRGELSKEQLEALSSILPGKVNPRPSDNNYEMLDDFDRENINTSEEGGKKQDP